MIRGTLEQVLGNLPGAWEHVRRCGPTPGVDAVGFAQFEQSLEVRLESLSTEIRAGSYQPNAVKAVKIRELSGKLRGLAIPTVRDRVLLRSVAETLSPLIEPRLSPSSYAFRPRRSALQAAAQVSERIKDGWSEVLRADIASFFDSIPRKRVFELVSTLPIDAPLKRLIERLIETPVFGPTGYQDADGLHQGSALSPLLSNMVLTDFDNEFEDLPVVMIRYCDDFIVMGRRKEAVDEAEVVARAELEKLSLTFNESKCWRGRAGDGFVFLGFHYDGSGRGPARKALETIRSRLAGVLSAAPPGAACGAQLASALRSWAVYYGRGARDFLGARDAVVVLARLVAAESHEERLLLRGAAGVLEAPRDRRRTRAMAELAGILVGEAPRAAARLLNLSLLSPTACGVARLAGLPSEDSPLVEAAQLGREALGRELERLGHYNWAESCHDMIDLEVERGAGIETGEIDDEYGTGLEQKPRAESGSTTEEASADGASASFDEALLGRFVDSFQGLEGRFQWVSRGVNGAPCWETVRRPMTERDARAHLSAQGCISMPVLRGDGRVRFAVIDIDVSRAEILAAAGQVPKRLMEAATADTWALKGAAKRLGLESMVERTGGRGLHLWFLFDRPAPAIFVRRLLKLVCQGAGPVPAGVHRELLPDRDRLRGNHAGRGMILPFGCHRKTGERSVLLTAEGEQLGFVEGMGRMPVIDADELMKILDRESRALAVPDGLVESRGGDPLRVGAIGELVAGCGLVRSMVDKAVAARFLSHRERSFLLATMAHLPGGRLALHAVMKSTMNYDRRVTERHIKRLKPAPISCPRARDKFGEEFGDCCQCQFDLPAGLYPAPVLYSRSWAQIPYLRERYEMARGGAGEGDGVRKAVAGSSGVEAGDVKEAMSRFLGARKRERKARREQEEALKELAAWMDSAGVDCCDIDEGLLRRVKGEDGEIDWRIEL
jgi:RNA-directed DNA polymerase